VREWVLEGFPDTEVQVSVVWIEMLPTDSFEAAQGMAEQMIDPRVSHYFDPRTAHLAGKALAHGIIHEGRGPAWDVYLFYDQEAEWSDEPPRPVEWCHQLSGGQRADPSLFAGGVVGEKLHQTMHDLTRTACAHAETAADRR
jgi:hypothetical protein